MSLFDDEDMIFDDDVIEDNEPQTQVISDSLKGPKESHFCIGHEKNEALFLDAFQKNTIPHAMIFSGIQGIGKTTMAFRLARFLLKNGMQDQNQDSLFGGADTPQIANTLDVPAGDPISSRVASGAHPDLLHIQRAYDSSKGKQDAALKVEALRKIEPFLRRTSADGGWRLVIVEDADTMNRSAQNAILKILEEPPKNVLIILVTHRIGMLIPTILSRSRVIKFDPLSSQNMKVLFEKQGEYISAQDMDTLNLLSQGSIGKAFSYKEDEGLETLSKIMTYLGDVQLGRWSKIHEFANTVGVAAKDKEYRVFAEVLQFIFRHVLFLKARGVETLPEALSQSFLQNYIAHTPLERMITISDSLKAHFERIDFSNLDRRDAVRTAFLVISQ